MTAAVTDTFTAANAVSGTVLTLPVPRAVAAGTTIALATTRADASGIAAGLASITDSKGNTWVRRDAFTLRSNTNEVIWSHAHVTTALAAGDTITVTWNGSSGRKALIAHVITGLQPAAAMATSGTALANNPSNIGPNGFGTAVTGSTAAATTAAAGILLAAVGFGSGGGALTPGSGFTAGGSVVTTAGSSDRRLSTEYRLLTTTGVKTADGTLAASAGWAEAIVAFAATASSSPPTADAGPDQTVEPWSTFPLGGTDTAAAGTTITGIAWTSLSGPVIPLSSTTAATPTGQAPPAAAQATAVLRKTVTDGNGATDPDDVSVTILPATEFSRQGGVLVPFQFRS